MSNLNTLAIEGRLTRDVEIKNANGDLIIAKFSIANNEYRKTKAGESNEEVSYFDVMAFGKLADICGKYLVKGSRVNVAGRMKQERWNDKDGKARSRIVVIAKEVFFLSPTNKEAPSNQNESQEFTSGFGSGFESQGGNYDYQNDPAF